MQMRPKLCLLPDRKRFQRHRAAEQLKSDAERMIEEAAAEEATYLAKEEEKK
jgi:hypothetical protein